MHNITPIVAFNIEQGKATAISGGPLDLNASQGYRWTHVNSQHKVLRPLAKELLPDIATRALW